MSIADRINSLLTHFVKVMVIVWILVIGVVVGSLRDRVEVLEGIRSETRPTCVCSTESQETNN